MASALATPTVDRPRVDLTWDSMKYSVVAKNDDGSTAWKPLLKGVSGTARAARTLAVMGPSGAGKSTFLNGISGRLAINKGAHLAGTAYLNDSLFLSKYKPLISYVAQDDIVMGKDTPREALTFAYRMRTGASAEAAAPVVEDMIKELKLEKAADTLLGIPGLLKGVSGGEKKRTNIGSELITNPVVMLLDEPTTGLDSVNALNVGQLLRDLAHDEGRTVICTIHTPSSELFDVFDDVLLLAKGNVIYHGPVKGAPEYFARLGHAVPPRTNPSEHYMNLLQLPEEELEKLVDGWKKYTASPDSASNKSINNTPKPSDVVMGLPAFDAALAAKNTSSAVELALLTERSWRNVMRDPAATLGKLIQVLFFAVLLALFFANVTNDDDGVTDRAGVLFMFTLNLIFLNAMNAIAVFPPERAVFLQEQTSSMYSAAMYYLSKVIAELPINIILPIIYVVITYWSWGLASGATAFFNHLAIAMVVGYTGNAFGLFAASLFPSPEITMTIAPLMLMPLMLVGGLFANTERLEPGFVWLNYISFPRYGFKAFMVNEFHNVELCPPRMTVVNGTEVMTRPCRYLTGEEALKVYGFDKDTVDTVWFNIVMLLVMMIILRIIGALGLHVQGASRRSELVFEGNFRRQHKTADAVEMTTVNEPIENQ